MYCHRAIENGLAEMKRLKLPRIIWVAARPPVPPFDGANLKTYFGLTALASVAELDVVVFANRAEQGEVRRRFEQFWSDASIRLRVLEYGPKAAPVKALLQRRFRLGMTVERSDLRSVLNDMEWRSPERLIIFDDIIFAPLTEEYGSNAVLSPHDCISEMFLSHAVYSFSRREALKYRVQSHIARHYEESFYHLPLLTHLVTERDRILVQKINGQARCHVIPNADLPSLTAVRPESCNWDVLVWADLRIASAARGVQAFLEAWYQRGNRSATATMALAGRVPRREAERLLGKRLLASVDYTPLLEDESGTIRHAKVTVVPDFGGAGIKNRCLSILATGKCLACLYLQMEGVDKLCDRGAINASSMKELVRRITVALESQSYAQIAATGEAAYRRDFSESRIREMWITMVQRALAVRSIGSVAPASTPPSTRCFRGSCG